MAAPSLLVRRWTRAEYDRLIEGGFFRPGEPVELIGGQLMVCEPQGDRHAWALALVDRVLEVSGEPVADAAAPYGWRYASVTTLGPGAAGSPLVVPAARIPVADLLP